MDANIIIRIDGIHKVFESGLKSDADFMQYRILKSKGDASTHVKLVNIHRFANNIVVIAVIHIAVGYKVGA